MESTFARYAERHNLLVQLFNSKFAPTVKPTPRVLKSWKSKLPVKLEHVANLDDDQHPLLCRYDKRHFAYHQLFQKLNDGADKPYISLKLARL